MRFTVLVLVLFVMVVCPMAANPTSCAAGGQNKTTDDVKLVQGTITHRYRHRLGTAAGTDPSAGTDPDVSQLKTLASAGNKREKPHAEGAHTWGSRKNLASRILVVPSLRFLFCYIEKNACTQFNLLANALNGILEEDNERRIWPYFRSSAAVNFKWTSEQVQEALNDESWYKAVFLRDPAERLLSAYNSKCEEHDGVIEDGGRHCLLYEDDRTPAFPEFVADLAEHEGELNHDPHFALQSAFCGGLESWKFDFVGNISDTVNQQVRRMMVGIGAGETGNQLADKFFPPGEALTKPSHTLTNASSLAADVYTARLRSIAHNLYEPDYQLLNDVANVSTDDDREASSVWIHSFGRSGSTALFDMLVGVHHSTFGLFEPCHVGDVAEFDTCTEEMRALISCDFTRVQHLEKWRRGHHENYSSELASEKCRRAHLRVFKTIHMHSVAEDARSLSTEVGLKVISLVRDPRAIYYSAKRAGMVSLALRSIQPEEVGLTSSQHGSLDLLQTRSAEGYIDRLCDTLASRAHIGGTPVLRVKFEELLSSPGTVARDIFRFIGVNKGDKQLGEIIAQSFPRRLNSSEIQKANHLDDEWQPWEVEAFKSTRCHKALELQGYEPWTDEVSVSGTHPYSQM